MSDKDQGSRSTNRSNQNDQKNEMENSDKEESVEDSQSDFSDSSENSGKFFDSFYYQCIAIIIFVCQNRFEQR